MRLLPPVELALNPRARGEWGAIASERQPGWAGPRSAIACGGRRDGNRVRRNMPYAATHPARLMRRGYGEARRGEASGRQSQSPANDTVLTVLCSAVPPHHQADFATS